MIGPGIHSNVPAVEYHADPCSKPSLTASIAKLLCDKSPLHAWHAHPRLNPKFTHTESGSFDVGTAAHAMLLEGDDVCMPVDAADWRTKAARERRDEIRAAGRIPVLLDEYRRITDLVAAVEADTDELNVTPPVFTGGRAEQVLVWEEPEGVVCRSRVDWLRDDHAAFDDLKTTKNGASPAVWANKRLWDFGLDVQAAFYARGIKALTGRIAEPRFIIVESEPPYAVSVLGLAPSALALGHEKVQYAIDTWRSCTSSNYWPGYTRSVAYAETPAWVAAKWMERQYGEDVTS